MRPTVNVLPPLVPISVSGIGTSSRVEYFTRLASIQQFSEICVYTLSETFDSHSRSRKKNAEKQECYSNNRTSAGEKVFL